MANKKKLFSSMIEFKKYNIVTINKRNSRSISKTFWFKVVGEKEKERQDKKERIEELKSEGIITKYFYEHRENKSNK